MGLFGIGFVLGLLILVIVGISTGLRRDKEYKQGVELANSFKSLGDLRGKSLSQIIAVAGYPDNVVRSTRGGHIYKTATWQCGTYTIVLLFDENNIFSEIVSDGFGDLLEFYGFKKD